MSDTDVALQFEHVMLLKDVAHQAASLAYAQLAVTVSGDTRGVLAAMLQDRQTVIDSLIDRTRTDDADNSAHAQPPLAIKP